MGKGPSPFSWKDGHGHEKWDPTAYNLNDECKIQLTNHLLSKFWRCKFIARSMPNSARASQLCFWVLLLHEVPGHGRRYSVPHQYSRCGYSTWFIVQHNDSLVVQIKPQALSAALLHKRGKVFQVLDFHTIHLFHLPTTWDIHILSMHCYNPFIGIPISPEQAHS